MNLYLLAAVLTLHGDTVPTAPPCPLWAMQDAAVAVEILDRRECGYWFADAQSWQCDCRAMQKLCRELADAPHLCEAQRWPSRDWLREQRLFGSDHYRLLKERAPLFPRDKEWFWEALAETEACCATYSIAEDVNCPYYYVAVRRRALARLRDRLGPHAYYAGVLPPVVPAWTTRRTD